MGNNIAVLPRLKVPGPKGNFRNWPRQRMRIIIITQGDL